MLEPSKRAVQTGPSMALRLEQMWPHGLAPAGKLGPHLHVTSVCSTKGLLCQAPELRRACDMLLGPE